MKLRDYQRASRATAIYPEAGSGSTVAITYCRLGLVNEAGEVGGKVKKAMRDGVLATHGRIEPERAKAILDECGDVLWYLAQLGRELGFELVDPHDDDPGAGRHLPRDLPALALVLSMRCVNVSGMGLMDPGFVVASLSGIVRTLGSSLGEVAEANIAKLTGRAERGTLGGDGDVR